MWGNLAEVLSRFLPELHNVLFLSFALHDPNRLEAMLVGAGFRDVRVERTTREDSFESFADYWEPIEAGIGSIPQAYLRLAAMDRRAVRDEVRSRLLRFESDGKLRYRVERAAIPGMSAMPRMWAVIGIYSGREDNIFWRRVGEPPNKIEAVGAKALCEGDAEPLGTDIIHSVLNPIDRLTGAIHIYGGDFFATPRSEWDSLSLLEHHSDGERTRRMFEEANARFEASKRVLGS
jgi:predicted metal-dependent enzyme (double-stranded beta helix superfamily)